jgi:hypothetical protein
MSKESETLSMQKIAFAIEDKAKELVQLNNYDHWSGGSEKPTDKLLPMELVLIQLNAELKKFKILYDLTLNNVMTGEPNKQLKYEKNY